jgi:hypothetical protein
MVMEEAGRAGAHQAGRDLRCGRLHHEGFELRDALPVAEVLEEGGRAVCWSDRAFERAGIGHQRIDTRSQRLDPGVEDAAQQDHAVLAIAWRRIVRFREERAGLHALPVACLYKLRQQEACQIR